MLGDHEDGLSDINHSFQLDAENAYAHRNLGVYYFENKKYIKALASFEKAKLIDDSTHQIDRYIADTILEINKIPDLKPDSKKGL
jgi:tetratricopeptide (TPR) repeat protein